jgi:hypothetical protein
MNCATFSIKHITVQLAFQYRLAATINFVQLNEPSFHVQNKNYQVDFSKTSFSVAHSGDEKVYKTKRIHFCMSSQKNSRLNQVFGPAMIRPCDENPLR